MKTFTASNDHETNSRAAANERKRKGGPEMESCSVPLVGGQARKPSEISVSPFMVSQRKRLKNISAPVFQKQADEDEELMQGKMAAQKQAPEEEELLQGKEIVQRQEGLEDEELMQGEFAAQRQTPEEEELLQGRFASHSGSQNLQRKKNRTGMPDELKGSMERTFDTDLSDVRVHPNSKKATDVGALAYTQGTEVHFAPGQFKPQSVAGRQLIGHELVHVQQQREGRVAPTTEVNGLPVNDSPDLELEADELGKKVD
jgi:hypothetical protein